MNLGRIPAKTALLDPEREALIDIPNDRRMTFGALDERVRRLANAFAMSSSSTRVIASPSSPRIASSTWKCSTPARAAA
jgi:acyl-CoA synthetase (AMP-forming)/AMP-acid ligase II